MYTFIDLFAGIGGIRIAFERQGCECVFSSEWDEKAQETYFENFGHKPLGDIRGIPSLQIPDHDILLGGFPCQPFSIAGVSKKNSLGLKHGFEDETQGTLFFEIARIIRDKKPRAFLLENVKNLRSHDNGKTFRTVMKVLQKELGYKVYETILDAQGLVPQHRERLYMVGFLEHIEFNFPDIPLVGPGLGSILEDNVPDKYTLTDKLWSYLQKYAEKHKELGNGFGFGLANLENPSRTLSARYYKDGSEILLPQEGKNPRRLTPRECARLQGFPEDFKIKVSDTAAYKQFGNSVSIPIVAKIAENIITALTENIKSSSYHRGEFNLDNIRDEAIARASQFGKFFCKYISANDTGKTGGHQSGFYVAKSAWPLLFDEPGTKEENKERQVKIHWEQLDYHTDNMFKWYGKGTRSEYRITRFGKGFPYFADEYIGDLFILIQINNDEFIGYVLSGDDAEAFLETFSISPTNNIAVYGLWSEGRDSSLEKMIEEYANTIISEFPATKVLTEKTREIYYKFYKQKSKLFDRESTDKILLRWIDIEYSIFKALERSIYQDQIEKPFDSVDTLIEFANTALNRRKSRAGRSFEHHLNFIFSQWGLNFSHPGKSEGKKKPDFMFPGNNEYADSSFPEELLTFLGAKTTCKDRWRQILNEANRTPIKYLTTMEKGISSNQLQEMEDENVILIVPEEFHEYYPKEFQSKLMTLSAFCQLILDKSLQQTLL